MIKHVLSIDIQQKGDLWVFTIHLPREINTLEVNSLSEGFKIIERLINAKTKQ